MGFACPCGYTPCFAHLGKHNTEQGLHSACKNLDNLTEELTQATILVLIFASEYEKDLAGDVILA